MQEPIFKDLNVSFTFILLAKMDKMEHSIWKTR
jgi:hypothetical protein